jgi:hypothetical protein
VFSTELQAWSPKRTRPFGLARAAASRPERVASPPCEASMVWLEARIAEDVRSAQSVVWCGLTFELSRQAEAGAGWPRKDNSRCGLERPDGACRSGSALERGVRHQFCAALCADTTRPARVAEARSKDRPASTSNQMVRLVASVCSEQSASV